MAFNRKQKLRDNIEAIRTAFILDREQRTPTARERLLLERYCGFGVGGFVEKGEQSGEKAVNRDHVP